MSEKRRHARRPLRVEFRCNEQAGIGHLTFEAEDLSVGGAFLKSDLLLEPGEGLALEFALPGRKAPVRASARVAWARRFPEGEEPGGMGIAFAELSDEDRRAIEKYIGGGR